MSELMTRREREDLSKIFRINAKVAKTTIDARAADLRADVDRQLSTIYQADAEQWREITAEAERAIQDADRQIARICQERGVPARFRPSLHVYWSGRGENGVKARRVELQAAAYAKIDADRKAAYQYTEAKLAEKLTALIAGLLTSDEATNYLASLPSPESLLPPITVRAELGDGAAR